MANNVFVYCEIEGTLVQEVSQELLTKGRKLANTLGVELHAVVAGTGIKGKVEDQILPIWCRQALCFRCQGPVPLHLRSPHRYPREPLQGRAASDLSDGCYRDRS